VENLLLILSHHYVVNSDDVIVTSLETTLSCTDSTEKIQYSV